MQDLGVDMRITLILILEKYVKFGLESVGSLQDPVVRAFVCITMNKSRVFLDSQSQFA